MHGGTASEVTLRRVRPEWNERRFYRLEVTRDLFGTILLLRRWGRIGTDGRQITEAFADEAAADAALAAWVQAKRRRGYWQVGLPAVPTFQRSPGTADIGLAPRQVTAP